jgi:predicted DNA-binding transcriptional regulator YafY
MAVVVTTPVRARAMVVADRLSLLRWRFGNRVRIRPSGTDGRVEVELRSASTRSLAGDIAGFGGSVEVLEPTVIRDLLAEIARELGQLYGRAGG